MTSPAATSQGAGEDPHLSNTSGEELLVTPRFRVIRRQERCRDGSIRSREIVEHPGSVVILPMLDDDRVCLIEVFRQAVGRVLWELPAGTLDREESLVEAARRELEEETGYRAETVEPLGGFWMSPGILRERMHLFLARGLEPGPQALEPGERITAHVINWQQAIAMCLDGRIEDAKTVAAIMRYEALRHHGS